MADPAETSVLDYEALVPRFREFVRDAVPTGATVLVASKGDQDLLALEERRGWHFPQRADGVYAGYYPADSKNAIGHLETLRKNGAEFIAFPAAALWWLDQYPEFGRHLDSRYREVARDGQIGAIYALDSDRAETGTGKVAEPGAREPGQPRTTAATGEEGSVTEVVRTLFDPVYYGRRLDVEFGTADKALEHYLASREKASDPHPLFDSVWYLRRNPEVARSGVTPLLHFVTHGCAAGLDPNPYFDTDYYYSQRPGLRERGGNALAHYVCNALTKDAAHPNPLFHDSFYLATYRNVASEASTPLAHLLTLGFDRRRFGSALHRNIFFEAQRPGGSLTRGRWRQGTALFFTSGDRDPRRSPVFELAETLGDEYHLGSVIVACVDDRRGRVEPSVVLDDFKLAAEVLRPAALRLLARSLAALHPRFAVTDIDAILDPLVANGTPTIYLLPEGRSMPSRAALAAAVEDADVAVADSVRALATARERLGRHPGSGDFIPLRSGSGRDSASDRARALADVASERLGVELAPDDRGGARRGPGRPKILIPCSDWEVSGVNVSLEAVGTQLLEHGWDLEVVFTRPEEAVLKTVPNAQHLPTVPFRYLPRSKIGVLGMWEELIADLESNAPSILFMSYDFLANSVAPALTDQVGVVAWAQADDGDYYEQAYRLGPYCNALACVSERIKDAIGSLNPAIGERAHVIPNSSVSSGDIVSRRPRGGPRLRLVYCGRLVEYQKRVLEFVALAEALDRVGLPYEISLIGTFSSYEDTEDRFRELAADHLADGRITLRGRLSRAEVLEELTRNDFFVLLSDFEGLPLSVGEAMARGCVPVVADSESGIPDLIDHQDDGLILRGRNYDEWAGALAELWRDRKRYGVMSRNARAKVRDQFTVEHVGARFAELFDRVAAEMMEGTYRRPPSLHWGERRSKTGDVLPPPSMHDPGGFGWV